ncbi:hypothetical protein IJ670_01580, partial [bacterium]|nr:hypothetical protein [bacterium]
FLPHLLWLIKYDFFPILYFEGELSSDTFLNHIIAPLTFMVVQISAILGVVVIYTFLKLKQKSKFIFLKTINKDAWFLIFRGLFPLFAHIIMGFMMGGPMRPRWGFEFLYMVPVLLFYFLPSGEISRKDFDFVVKFSYFAMFVTFIVMGSLLSVEKNYRSRYPYEQLYTDFNNVWENKFHTSLKYLGGYIEWTLPLTIYGKTHPTCILDTNGYKNPWLDENELKKNGCMIINRTKDQVIGDIRKYCPYIDDNSKYEPIEYKFDVENAFGIKREYIIYYLIIPPIKE